MSDIGRKGLADLFTSMVIKDAHWYSIVLLDNPDCFNSLHDQVFPSLSKILHIDEEMMRLCLQSCGLLRFKKGSGFIPVVDAWRDFFKEYFLDEAEVTHFSPVNRRKRIYVRIGMWKNNDRRTPGDIWSLAMAGHVVTPRLRITSLGNNFARTIGEMGIHRNQEGRESGEESAMSSASEASDVDSTDTSADVEEKQDTSYLPDAKEFPILHYLFSSKHCGSMDSLLREITNYHKKNSSILFRKGNNTDGTLLIVPSYRDLGKYRNNFTKPNSIVTEFVRAVATNSKSGIDEASECILTAFSHHFEDSFYSTAVNTGVASGLGKKMDALSVEAMLSESRVQLSKARVMFRHIACFFGRSLFESEKKRRKYFGDNDFRPTVNKKELPDKTIVYYWYKLPDALLKHQINEIVSAADLEGLQQVDIATGGDHGGGRF